MDAAGMREFWDARSREDAYFFVDNTLRYGDPNVERFWSGGDKVVDTLSESLGFTVGPQEDVVDVGCGLGRITRALAGRARHVHAIDVSPEMLRRARELNPQLDNVDWHEGDGTSLRPLGDASVDGVFSWVVFQHIPDPEITLGYVREMGRVLRPGGWAAFGISDDPRIHAEPPLGERVKRRLQGLVGRGPKGQTAPQWRGSAVGLARVRETGEASGLRVERATGEGTQFCCVLLRRSPA
jgi:SAM-dependent methyltransferase